MLLSNNNSKVKALIFDLPTRICNFNCKKCYAKKAEKRFPLVVKKREYNYNISIDSSFINKISSEIRKSKIKILRIHSSGDFYSQEYIDKWNDIIKSNRDIKFYAYTKSLSFLNFTKIEKNENFNLISSFTEDGNLNYGTLDYCNELVKMNDYYLCECHIKNIKCMVDCKECLTRKKVCFVEH